MLLLGDLVLLVLDDFLDNGQGLLAQLATQALLSVKRMCQGNELHVHIRQRSYISCSLGELLHQI